MTPSDAPATKLLRFPSEMSSRLANSELDVVVTGATGWMGRATLEMLDSCLGSQFATRVHAFGSTGRSMELRSGTMVTVHPLAGLAGRKIGRHLLAHYAFATKEFVGELGVPEYVRRNQEVTELVVAHVARSAPTGLVVPSSGAIYGEGDLGTNPYAELKRRDEATFLALAHGMSVSGAPVRAVVPRVFNLAGPFLNKPERYALGSILTDIGNGGPIRLTASRPVIRSYIHVGDLISLAFAVMTGDGPAPDAPFDTAGEREIEVGALAELAASVLGRPGMAIERPRMVDHVPDRYVGDPADLNALAAGYGVALRPLAEQIEDTARFMGI